MKNKTILEASKNFLAEINSPQPQISKIKQYITDGADINYQSTEDGYTALMLAVDNDDEPTVSFLLKQGANPLIKNHHNEIASNIALDYSPIYLLLKNHELLTATYNNEITDVKAILAAGADVNFQGPNGYTALLIATEHSLLELVEFLLIHNADTSMERNDGWGVLDLASDTIIYRTLEYKKPFSEEQKKTMFHQDDPGRWERWRLKTLEARNGLPFALSQLKMSNFSPAPSEAQLNELEQHFGHPLPNTLKEIFTHYNGGNPYLDHFGEEDEEGNIGYFYALDDHINSVKNIWNIIKNFSEDLGSDTLPFAENYFGDIYFLKWVKDHAQVWMFEYSDSGYDYEEEEDYDENKTPSASSCIFNSLDELLEALYAAQD